MRRILSMAALGALLTIGTTARADNAEAERLFREAVRLRDSGDFAAACPKFAESFAAEPAPGTLVNLGDCEVRIGKLVSAAEHYRLAGAGFPKGDKRRDMIAQKVASLEPKLAHLTVHLAPSVPATAKITRGGAPMERKEIDAPLTVDPGAQAIIVAAPDRKDAVYDLKLAEGETKEITIDVGAPVEVKIAPPPAVSPTSGGGITPLRAAGLVVGGIGVVGLGLGVVTGIMAMGKASIVSQHCNTATYDCDQEGVDAARAGEVLAPLSTVSFIAGGVLLTGGLVMVLVGGKKKEASMSFVPSIGPDGSFAATWLGRF